MNLITDMRLFIKKFSVFCLAFITMSLFVQSRIGNINVENESNTTPNLNANPDSLFKLKLVSAGLSPQAFEIAMAKFHSLTSGKRLKNDSLLTIIDFNQPSFKERFYLLDVKNKKLVKQTLVAHGKNTGMVNAVKFSNRCHSLQSSLGTYITGKTYSGKHGYSLRLDGMEPGFNSNARQRAVVVHAADYVAKDFIAKNGRIGRSFGCPALPVDENNEIINLIKNKSCLFIYHKTYLSKTNNL